MTQILIPFMDSKFRKLVDIPLERVTKETFNTMYGNQKRYALKGITEDGRTLTKFVGKGYWDLVEIPEPAQLTQMKLI